MVSDREGGDAEEAAGVADVGFVGVVETGLLVSAGVALGLCDVCVGRRGERWVRHDVRTRGVSSAS